MSVIRIIRFIRVSELPSLSPWSFIVTILVTGVLSPCWLVPCHHAGWCLVTMLAGVLSPCWLVSCHHAGWCLVALLAPCHYAGVLPLQQWLVALASCHYGSGLSAWWCLVTYVLAYLYSIQYGLPLRKQHSNNPFQFSEQIFGCWAEIYMSTGILL